MQAASEARGAGGRTLGRGPGARIPSRRLGRGHRRLAFPLPAPRGVSVRSGRDPGDPQGRRGGGDGAARRHPLPDPTYNANILSLHEAVSPGPAGASEPRRPAGGWATTSTAAGRQAALPDGAEPVRGSTCDRFRFPGRCRGSATGAATRCGRARSISPATRFPLWKATSAPRLLPPPPGRSCAMSRSLPRSSRWCGRRAAPRHPSARASRCTGW